MKLKELLKYSMAQDIILKITDEYDKVIDTEMFYYDDGYTIPQLEIYGDYKVSSFDAWEYSELRIFINK